MKIWILPQTDNNKSIPPNQTGIRINVAIMKIAVWRSKHTTEWNWTPMQNKKTKKNIQQITLHEFHSCYDAFKKLDILNQKTTTITTTTLTEKRQFYQLARVIEIAEKSRNRGFRENCSSFSARGSQIVGFPILILTF